MPHSPLPGHPVRGSSTGRPIMAALDLVGRRWALRILWELQSGSVGARELARRCDGMSSSVLYQRLEELVAARARGAARGRAIRGQQDGSQARQGVASARALGPGVGRESDTMTRHRRWPLVPVALAFALVVGWVVVAHLAEPDSPSAFLQPARSASRRLSRHGDPIREGRIAGRRFHGDPRALPVDRPRRGAHPGLRSRREPRGHSAARRMAGGRLGARHDGHEPRCAPLLRRNAGTGKIPASPTSSPRAMSSSRRTIRGLGTPGVHPYLVGESEGRVVLDSIRAARSLLPDQTSDTTAIFGHSQGGHAVLFAAELAPTYAPELRVVGRGSDVATDGSRYLARARRARARRHRAHLVCRDLVAGDLPRHRPEDDRAPGRSHHHRSTRPAVRDARHRAGHRGPSRRAR